MFSLIFLMAISRHNFTKDSLKEIISEYQNQSVCVIGDLIVDEYITCDP